MTPEDIALRREEVKKGKIALQAYNSYFVNFTEKKNEELLDQFRNADPFDVQLLQILKFKQLAIFDLANTIQNDILTGKMAEKSLEDNDNGNK